MESSRWILDYSRLLKQLSVMMRIITFCLSNELAFEGALGIKSMVSSVKGVFRLNDKAQSKRFQVPMRWVLIDFFFG